MPKRILFTGPISSGKTTKMHQMAEQLRLQDFTVKIKEEDIQTWSPSMIRSNAIIAKSTDDIHKTIQEVSYDDQIYLGEFQIITQATRMRDQNEDIIDPQTGLEYDFIFYERSMQESYHTFLQVLRLYITNPVIWDTFSSLHEYLLQFEIQYDEIIQMDIITIEETMSRILHRNRTGETVLPQYYLELLIKQYNTFIPTKQTYKTEYFNQTHLVAGPGIGKSTVISMLQGIIKNVIHEQLSFWGEDLLEQHTQNINRRLGNNSTFLFQLRVILSRIMFRKDNTMYERHIMEEQMVFIPTYKFAFSDTQWTIINMLYDVLIPIFMKNTSFVILRCGIDQQMQQIKKRNRGTESEYTVQYIQELNDKYDSIVFPYIRKSGCNYLEMMNVHVDHAV